MKIYTEKFYETRTFKVGNLNPSFSHGLSKTQEYKIWSGILSRCYNSKVKIYKYYGGRGIKVCESWLKFENFFKDIGFRPTNKHQIDRINNDGNYEKTNCHWVLPKENNPYLKGTIIDNMPDKTFGKWLVIARVNHKPGHWYYLCKCECGIEKIISGGQLRRGRSTQCKDCKNIAHRGWHERKDNIK